MNTVWGPQPNDLQREEGGRLTTEIHFNENGPYKSIVDTGADNLAIPLELFKDLVKKGIVADDLKTAPLANTAGGKTVQYETRIQTLRAFGKEIKNVKCYVVPDLEQILIGINPLRQFGVRSIDIVNDVVNF
jgi:predicted aspartyl protease